MPIQQVQVGAPSKTSLPAGAMPALPGGHQGEGIFSQLHGKYYNSNYYDQLYYSSNAAAGAAFTIFSNASYVGHFIWNPQGSGKNLSIAKVYFGFDAQASTAVGAFGYAWLVNAGASLATAAPVSATTAITATRGSCKCGPPGQGNSVALTGSAATLTTALTWGRAANVFGSTGAITTEIAKGGMCDDVDGTMIVPPGTFWAVTTTILTGWTVSTTVIWEELPL